MRTRDEVLAELRQRFGTDDYCQSDVNGIDLYAMADHIVAVERQRDEYHAMWKQETLAKRELADRIRELEARDVPEAHFGNPHAASEPVAWGVFNDANDLLDAYATKKQAHDWLKVSAMATSVGPLYSAPPSAAAVTEAMVEAAARAFYGAFYDGDRLWVRCPDDIRVWWMDAGRDALTAALTAASEGASDANG